MNIYLNMENRAELEFEHLQCSRYKCVSQDLYPLDLKTLLKIQYVKNCLVFNLYKHTFSQRNIYINVYTSTTITDMLTHTNQDLHCSFDASSMCGRHICKNFSTLTRYLNVKSDLCLP